MDVPEAYRDALPDRATLLLAGVVGSTAYGLARPGSDRDRLGVFAYPTERILGLSGLAVADQSIVRHKPEDTTLHEVGKTLGLLLKVNPTVTEILWLPTDLIEHCHPFGTELVGMRRSFLSAKFVRAAYVGYAHVQLTRADRREDTNLTNGGVDRNAKAARHMRRLLMQAQGLWTTGELTVQLDDPQTYFDFGVLPWEDQVAWFEQAKTWFDTAPTVLPEQADRRFAEDFLLRLRREFYT